MKRKHTPLDRSNQATPTSEHLVRNQQATRETVESIVVAIILAFLFRAFVAEAFVIPTGSMAKTLRGRHMDIVCPQCGYEYHTGASMENYENGRQRGEVSVTTCPICRFSLELNKEEYPNYRSFNGDRILVSKFAYQLHEPERWDVIVFKYPGNAKQNYIKRLVGLPGETLRIRHGDIFSVDTNGQARIVRKSVTKLRAMLQVVDDTDHVASQLVKVGWPSQWQQAAAAEGAPVWNISKRHDEFTIADGSGESWLRYRHLLPTPEEWYDEILHGNRPTRIDQAEGQLITDYYAYNDTTELGYSQSWEGMGRAWVGDLAVECDVNVQSDDGELLLDLVEGGAHHQCRIDLSTGAATLSIREFDGTDRPFGADGEGPLTVEAATKLRGPGTRHLRFANCDDQLVLWINNHVVAFDGPTTFDSGDDVKPRWSPQDPGDIAPVGIGTNGAALSVRRLRILRDVYYLAQEADQVFPSEYGRYVQPNEFYTTITSPSLWQTTDIFDARRTVEFELAEDHFFPLGDNSPQSKDARLWSEGTHATGYHDPPPYVERKLLIGKALVVYWPHGWRPGSPLLSRFTLNYAFIPNFGQMGLIH